MENNTKSIFTLQSLMDEDARKFIIGEVQLKNILPEWIAKAGSLKLKTVLEKYLHYVEQHVQEMEGFFEAEHIISLSLNNRIMHAFIEEAKEKLSACADNEVTDACLLASVQAINHFKISSYGTAAAFANALGLEKPATIFHEAEISEKQIDDRLSQLAEHEINVRAKAPIVIQR